jgi:hypothetical protein
MRNEETDVLIVGGGTGGVTAALAAARAGAKVTMLETEPTVGGTITRGYVSMPCGKPITGVYGQMIAELDRRYPLESRPKALNWYLPSSWLAVMNGMLHAAGVRVICGCPASTPLLEDGGARPRVAGALLPLPGEEVQIRAAVTIDATGSGSFAEAAGCEAMYGTDGKQDFGEPHAPDTPSDFVQHCTLMYVSQKRGNGPAFDMSRLRGPGVLEGTLGWFHKNREESMARDAGIYLHWGSAVPCRDTRDSLALAEAQEAAQREMEPDLELLHANGYITTIAPNLGVREVRRIVGEHVISECDLRSGTLPDDTIAIGQYGLDIWGGNVSHEETKVPDYGIPYRALVPKGVEGLLLAGKAISGTHIAMSAYRVQPILATYSQAAGVAAAWCARRDAPPRDVDVGALQAALICPSQGVDLPPVPVS